MNYPANEQDVLSKMAAATRGGEVDGVIFHGDRGSEYTSEACNGLGDTLGVVQLTGHVGSALDNAAAESFKSLIKVEYIHRHHFTARDQARIKIATWITDFYNTRRRHTSAAGHAPAEFERLISNARAEHIQLDRPRKEGLYGSRGWTPGAVTRPVSVRARRLGGRGRVLPGSWSAMLPAGTRSSTRRGVIGRCGRCAAATATASRRPPCGGCCATRVCCWRRTPSANGDSLQPAARPPLPPDRSEPGLANGLLRV
ncbi:hypothetical protein GCM10025734_02820 [Kitasatospora paranensis]